MAEAYSNFAAVYDALMDNIPYDAWADYLHGLLVEYDIASGILAELGCGTGNITERMADFGYDMIGIDNSPAMLDVVAEATIAEDRDDISFIWDNYYDEEEAINELALSLFVKEPSDSDADDNLFRKYEELHVQKGYTLKQMKQMVADSGLTLLAAYDAFTHEPADEECERIYIIAKETRNKNSKKQYIQ